MDISCPQSSCTTGSSAETTLIFCRWAGNPNISDIEAGRRNGNIKDYRDLLRLSQVINAVHGCTPMLEPLDVEPNVRYLDIIGEQLLLTDKIPFGYSLGRRKILDAIEMVRIARGIDAARLLEEPSLYTVVNVNSPLQLDVPMLLGIIEMSRRNQPVVITPFTLAGAMAPVTVAGRPRATKRRSVGGARLLSGRESRLPGGIRRVHEQCRHEVRLARVRNTGIRESDGYRRAAGAALSVAIPIEQHQRLELARRPGNVGKRDVTVGHLSSAYQHGGAQLRLDRRWVTCLVREVRDRSWRWCRP